MSNSVLRDPDIAIKTAASRVRGDRFSKLLKLLEENESLGIRKTRQARSLVKDLLESDVQDGIHFKALADEIRELKRHINLLTSAVT